MRPRSIGTRSSVARGARAATNASKLSASAAWMSRKKNAGALSGSAARNCRRRLPSISITVTSSARPRPSDSTTLTVSAPGRWMLAMANRSTVERMRGRRRAISIKSAATARSVTNTPAAAATKIAAMR